MPDKKPDLCGCAYCETGNCDGCVNAMCDCSCRTEGPWNWLRSKLSVEDFQRLSYQHGCVVIRVREEARMEWKPIDTAPKGGTPVLVCVGNYDECGDIGAHPITARYETFPPNAPGKASWRCLHGHKLWPTHWMPMPEAPRAAESKEG